MERIERRGNSVIRVLLRVLLVVAIIGAVLYGCSRIPFFVVKKNLALQYGFSYENHEDTVKKREKYVTETYYSLFQTEAAVQQRQTFKEHEAKCEILYLKLGERDADGAVPYTIIYELSFGDEALSTERVHLEGKQQLERFLGIWWKVNKDDVTHSCLFTGDVEAFAEQEREYDHDHAGHSHEHE